MSGTINEWCELCGTEIDFDPNDENAIKQCEPCIENTCEKCGGETSNRLAGDEDYKFCPDCKHVTR